MAVINPYINFDGNCEEAFNFYKSVFGGEFTDLNRYNGMPDSSEMSAADANRIMHVALPIGGGSVLMGSDSPPGMGGEAIGSNIQISIQTSDDAETDRLYNGLSANGQITMPLDKTFWGARFGMWVDKFGIQWMINQELNQAG
jgi:PhnB protein